MPRDASTAVDLTALQRTGPDPLEVQVEPTRLVLVAGPGTDVFTDPGGSPPVDAAPGLRLALHDPPVRFRVRVEPRLEATFDAGGLLVRTGAGAWAKLALERSPQGTPVVVSVVTTDTSDDANGPAVAGSAVDLRVHVDGTVIAFHHREDGGPWQLVRLFALPTGGAVPTVEMIAQSPTGEGCRVVFSDPHLEHGALSDLRDGS